MVAALASAVARAEAQATSPFLTIREEASRADIVTIPVKSGISVLTGSGGNIGVLSGRDGKFMIDGGIALSKAKLAAALAAIGNGRIKYVINTHYHWDHTDSNTWLHEAGATIVATPNAIKRLGQVTRVDDWNYTFQPLAAGGIPSVALHYWHRAFRRRRRCADLRNRDLAHPASQRPAVEPGAL